MQQRWQKIWSRPKQLQADEDLLVGLLEADGIGSGIGAISPEAWRAFVAAVVTRLGMKPGQSVFEVGCGAGAFLLPLAEAGLQISGLDYAAAQIELARQALPGGRFEVGEAAELSSSAEVDFAVSMGVFMYFPSQDYAARVLAGMLRLAGRGAAILDVPDLATRDACLAERRAFFGAEEYARRYQGLDHQFYARAWFVSQAAALGWHAEVESQAIRGYRHAPFRFNVFLEPAR